MPIEAAGVPRIRELIVELNNLAETRKYALDYLWTLETQGEKLRKELMQLLNHP